MNLIVAETPPMDPILTYANAWTDDLDSYISILDVDAEGREQRQDVPESVWARGWRELCQWWRGSADAAVVGRLVVLASFIGVAHGLIVQLHHRKRLG